MRIREYTSADLDALRHLHAAQGFGYPLPDLDSPLFVTKLVLEEDEVAQASASPSGRRACGGPLHDRDCDPSSNSATGARGVSITSEESCASRQDHLETHRLKSVLPESMRCRSPRIVMAVLLRLTAEAYLLHDPSAGTPRERWQRLLALHEAARQHAAARGLDDVQAFLPPRVARAFGRRLARLGWRRDPWPCFSRVTET